MEQGRSSPEVSSQLPPRPGLNSARAAPRSARGTVSGSMRSLSPALQVMQRSMFTPGPEVPKVPDAPRGERPREYLAALSGAAVLLEQPSSRPASARPASPRRRPSPDISLQRPSSPWRETRPSSERGRPSSARPSSALEEMKIALRRSRPTTPEFSEAQEYKPSIPLSARVRRPSYDMASDAQPAVQSARGSRQSEGRVRFDDLRLSAAPSVSDLWPKERRRVMVDHMKADDSLPFLPAAKSQKSSDTARVRSRSRDLDMDALDGLLASLDEERTENKTAQPKLPDSPASKTRSSEESSPRRKSGSAPTAAASKKSSSTGVWLPAPQYDEEFAPLQLPDEPDELQGSVYCPLSPTICSVYLPGSPTPKKAVELDDPAASLVVLSSGRPRAERGVRFEIRGPAADTRHHAPEAPKRRMGTGKLISRPRGCMAKDAQQLANFGGA